MPTIVTKPVDCLTGLQILLLLNDADSEKNIAAKCKLTPWQFSRAKNGAYKLKPAELKRIAKHFHCSEDFPTMLIHKTCILEPLRQFIQPKEDI